MQPLSRREMLRATALASGAVLQCPTGMRCDMNQQEIALDRKHLLAAGFTDAEADCWEAVGDAAGKFLSLPLLHKGDQEEIAQGIHFLQWKLMSRPTYRRYLQAARAEK